MSSYSRIESRTAVLILGVALGQYSCPRLNTTILGHNAGLILKHPFNNTIVEIKLIKFVLFPEGKKMFFSTMCDFFKSIYGVSVMYSLSCYCNMNSFFSFGLFMVYIPECKKQLRTIK
jgi:hypothetical protein